MTTRRILVIDDEVEILDVVRLAFDVTTDWVILTSATLADAEAAAADAAIRIDAVLLDLSVAGSEPRAAVTRIGKATRGTPVILLTATSLPDREVRELGAAGLIEKPFDPMRLADDIGERLGWT
jgi:two-component system alkaline phosphatase synthesis response regulator PhoP